MSCTITAAARRRSYLLAFTFLVSVVSLDISGASAQQAAPEQLPPIEINSPPDQNRTRAQPTYDETGGPRRAAPNTTPTSNANPAPGTGSNVSSGTSSGGSGRRSTGA